eukprot:365535-Chlamydomonas_euryale.AAC.84
MPRTARVHSTSACQRRNRRAAAHRTAIRCAASDSSRLQRLNAVPERSRLNARCRSERCAMSMLCVCVGGGGAAAQAARQLRHKPWATHVGQTLSAKHALHEARRTNTACLNPVCNKNASSHADIVPHPHAYT